MIQSVLPHQFNTSKYPTNYNSYIYFVCLSSSVEVIPDCVVSLLAGCIPDLKLVTPAPDLYLLSLEIQSFTKYNKNTY